jgi:general secretion pathway protein I
LFHITRSRRAKEAGFTMIEAVVALAVVAAVLASIGSLIAVARTGTRTLEQRVALSEALRLVSATSPSAEKLAGSELSGLSSGVAWRIAALPFVDQDAIESPSTWIPQRLVIQVRAPSGAVSSVETIQLVKRPPG